jgi:polysaccharide biosynthesis/export protein
MRGAFAERKTMLTFARSGVLTIIAIANVLAVCPPLAAQTASPSSIGASATAAAKPVSVTPPSDYVIGPDDHLSVVFWREADLSGDVIVRPDGMISLPLVNDVQAAGLTPEQLRNRITEIAEKYMDDPNTTVIVRQINSRKVFIAGQVEKPGSYPLTGPMTILQLVSTAGGLKEYANGKKIVVMHMTDDGRQTAHSFNYNDVINKLDVKQNIQLRPGDTVIVP